MGSGDSENLKIDQYILFLSLFFIGAPIYRIQILISKLLF